MGKTYNRYAAIEYAKKWANKRNLNTYYYDNIRYLHVND